MADETPLKILVVDDHDALRETVRHMLEAAHVTLLEARNGEEGVQIYRVETPDWVIMDLRMPGMGGLAATRAIRQLSERARVIVISQFVDPETAEQAHLAGAVEFLNKENLHLLPQIVQAGKT